MNTTIFAPMIFGFLLLASCDKSNRVYENDCKTPPANWITEEDFFRFISADGVVDPEINLMKLDRLGRVNWNGAAISRTELSDYLEQLDKLEAKPLLVLDIENETPCSHVEAVRNLMIQSATCRSREKLCTENLRYLEPPPPPDVEMNNITDTQEN